MIEVNNLTKSRISERFLKKVAKNALAAEKKDKDLSIAVVDSKEIKRLNKQYRKKNKPTDVLSFDYGESGEIVLCPQQIKGEIDQVLIHGILHVLGYNHREMKQKQNNG